LFRSILILYLFCFAAYIVFSRQPDYFDGDKSPAIIHMMKDSATALMIPKAVFSDGRTEHAIDARYFLREYSEGDRVQVIYESAQPDKAAVYTFWGYWITWGELLATFLIYIALFQIAVSVTKNPTAESLIEQLEFKEEKKRKYIE
jgi:hypothetical protein